MAKTKVLNAMIYLLIGLSFALIVISYQYYQEVKEEDGQFELFLNHFYHSMDNSIERIDYLIQKQPLNDNLDESLHNLEKELLKTDTIAESGRYYLNHNILNTLFFKESTYLIYGYRMTGTYSFEVPPFGEDGQLDVQELNLLKTMKKYLVEAKKEMYSPQTKQENPNLTIDEFNEIILKNLIKRPADIYKESQINENE